MMYKASAAGMGINWYHYNTMKFNVGFGVDNDNIDCPGVIYFSSMKNPANPGFSDSHIMETNYAGVTCAFYAQEPPHNLQLALEVHNLNVMQAPSGVIHPLAPFTFDYDNRLICNVQCPGLPLASSGQEAATSSKLVQGANIKVSPNPVINTLHIQFNSLSANKYQIVLTDIQGKVVLQRNDVYNNGSSATDLDMSSLAPGMYLLTVKKGDLVLQQKVMKQ